MTTLKAKLKRLEKVATNDHRRERMWTPRRWLDEFDAWAAAGYFGDEPDAGTVAGTLPGGRGAGRPPARGMGVDVRDSASCDRP